MDPLTLPQFVHYVNQVLLKCVGCLYFSSSQNFDIICVFYGSVLALSTCIGNLSCSPIQSVVISRIADKLIVECVSMNEHFNVLSIQLDFSGQLECIHTRARAITHTQTSKVFCIHQRSIHFISSLLTTEHNTKIFQN